MDFAVEGARVVLFGVVVGVVRDVAVFGGDVVAEVDGPVPVADAAVSLRDLVTLVHALAGEDAEVVGAVQVGDDATARCTIPKAAGCSCVVSHL